MRPTTDSACCSAATSCSLYLHPRATNAYDAARMLCHAAIRTAQTLQYSPYCQHQPGWEDAAVGAAPGAGAHPKQEGQP